MININGYKTSTTLSTNYTHMSYKRPQIQGHVIRLGMGNICVCIQTQLSSFAMHNYCITALLLGTSWPLWFLAMSRCPDQW